MSSKLGECWTMCVRCNCADVETPRRNNRVSPGDPIPVICVRPKTAQEYNNDGESLNGDSISNGEVNSRFSLHDESIEDSPGVGDQCDGSIITNGKSINTQNGDRKTNGNQLITTVFIETGKDKQLRVVHYKAKDISLSPNKKAAANNMNSSFISGLAQDEHENTMNDSNNENDTSTNENNEKNDADVQDKENEEDEEEEEEEYWFTKWSRKPRFNSIFAKSTIHAGDRRESCDSVADRNLEVLQEAERIADGVINEEDGEITQDAMDSIRWSRECSGLNNSDNQNSPKVQKEEIRQDVGHTNLGFVQEELENSNEETPSKYKEDNVDEASIQHPLSPLPPVSFMLGETSPLQSSESDRNMANSSIISASMVELEVLRDKSETLDVSSFKESKIVINSNSTSTINHYIPSVPQLPVLFFIHGISGSSEVWKSQIDFFHKLGYEMVVPDLLGHGLSSTPSQPKHYLLESLVQDLICVFDYFIRENTKTVIIGHGYGACLGTLLSRTRPKNTALLISISGGGPTPMVRPSCCQNSVLPLYCRLLHGKKRRGRFDNPDLRHVLPKVIHRNMIAGQIWEDGDSAFHRRITIPTLLVYGMRDKIVNLVEECEMERTIPRAFLELITTAGHMVMWDEPQKLNKMLAKFIQSWV